MPKAEFQIPFDSNGNMLSYAGTYFTKERRPNIQFVDTLVYTGFTRGRSAAGFCWSSKTTGKSFYMFMKEMDNVIRKGALNHGEVYGKWTFAKHGSNYSVRFLGAE